MAVNNNFFVDLVENAFHSDCSRKPDYFSSLSQRVRKIICRDTRYNIGHLYTTYVLNDEKSIKSYAVRLLMLMDCLFRKGTLRSMHLILRTKIFLLRFRAPTQTPSRYAGRVP